MSKSLRDELEAALAARTGESGPAHRIAVADAVVAGARRPRAAAAAGSRWLTRRRVAIAGISAVATIALGLGAVYGVPAVLGDDESGTGEPAAAPAGTPEPTMPGAQEPAVPAVPYFDDGIAADEYPSPAKDRGRGYPKALKMEKWVWDKVGPGWYLATHGELRSIWDDDTSAVRPGYFYLISPEGVYFNVGKVPDEVRNAPKLYSWDETKQRVRMGGYEANGGGLVSLKKLDFDPMVFAGGAKPGDQGFVAGSPAGVEVWQVGNKKYRWSADDGWKQILKGESRIVDGRDDIYDFPGAPGGEYVAFILCDGVDCSPKVGKEGRPRFVVYSLADDRSWTLKPEYGTRFSDCNHVVGWMSSNELALQCDAAGTSVSVAVNVETGEVSPSTSYIYWERRSADALAEAEALGFDLVFAGEDGDPTALASLHIEAASGETFNLEELGSDVSAGLESVREEAPGIFVVKAFDTVFHVDSVASELYVVTQSVRAPKSWRAASSTLEYGEASPYLTGLWGCDC